jgi:hypothetical protein
MVLWLVGSIIYNNIYQDIVVNFIENYPIYLVISPENYQPVFTSNIDHLIDLQSSANIGLVIVLFGLDLAYASLRLFIALFIILLSASILLFLMLWGYITLRRRWKFILDLCQLQDFNGVL